MGVLSYMLAAIFVVAVAFGAETEFQFRIGELRPAADRAFMLCNGRTLPSVYRMEPAPHIGIRGPSEAVPPVHLMGSKAGKILCAKVKDQKIQKRYQDHSPSVPGALDKLPEYQHPVQYGQILDL